ncbi:hypothetical protein GCM10022403_079450 [Streptomyces coacervatus]|uniref:Uncharacterized protein n=1 Tax=Streptomyces coacervatus TaxID=647381 RepID=A0ABP7J5K6_9ACTN|nr:hypothetical protein [Streptomyces coacervatus]MDF2269336.1 hypothetical protein [Streptomyces coacervatus]
MRLKSLEEALADARVLQGEYDTYDAARARHRIAKEAVHSRWERLFELRLPRVLAQRRCRDNPLAPRVDDGARRRIPRHAEAAQDLRAFSQLVIHDKEASAYVARFVNDRRIEPDGALIFACLLDLAQQEEGAQFWWQFAAGAGSATSAYCLYLMHLRRGELRDAEHWAEQVEQLDSVASQYRPRVLQLTTWHMETPARDLAASEPPSAALRDAIDHLGKGCDEDYGLVPQPDPALAERLEEFAAAS